MPIRMSGMISGFDTDAIVKELMSAQSLKKTKIEQSKEKLSWKKEKWEEMNTKLYSFYTDKVSPLRLQGSYLTKKVTSTNDAKATATASTAANGSYSLEIKQLSTAQYITGGSIKAKELTGQSTLSEAGMADQTITIRTGSNLENENTIDVSSSTTISEFVDQLKNAGLNASFDEANGRFFISAKSAGVENRFTLESTHDGESGLAEIGLGNITEAIATGGQAAAGGSEMSVVAAADAVVVLNGAELTSKTNSVTVNGLTINLTGTTAAGEMINLTVGNDTDAVYDKIKDFFDSYNELMKEMNTKYSAASAKDYAMLTDEEKEAMTDEQVELWENKIKDSLLRRDDTLGSLLSAFRTAMQATVEYDGKEYSLSSFGIGTGVYTENGIIHIDGNEDDGTYAGKTDKLRAAIVEDPEMVSKVFSQIIDGFYNTLTQKMSVTSISSALTFYNDQQIQTQLLNYEKQIAEWDDRLQDLEDRYYKQFSAMESSLADLQSRQNQLAGLLGNQ